MSDMSDRVEVIKAVFAGIKEIILALAAIATIWIQAQNSGKLDSSVAKTDAVQTQLELHDEKLSKIEKVAVGAENAADASAKSWRAYESKDPDDMDVARKALERARSK